MRLVIDLQGAQTECRFRGIGRYALSLATAMARQSRGHEVWLALNECFPETIEPLRAAFDGIIPQERICVFNIPSPVRAIEEGNEFNARTAALIREAFINNLHPDVVHLSSLFEGWIDDASVSFGQIPCDTPVVVTQYDLIPLLRKETYLSNTRFRDFYYRKLDLLKRADLLLAISEHSRTEALEALGFREDRIVNISSAVSPDFRPVSFTAEEKRKFLKKFGVLTPFILYSGGYDERKNVKALLESYSLLPASLRSKFSLVLTGMIPVPERTSLEMTARKLRIHRSVHILGQVGEADLISLYSLCHHFILPSLHEGFGLPALEAMACGAAVIASKRASIPEVIGREDALFDPEKPEFISHKIREVLEDETYREALRKHAREQAAKFSWDRCAGVAWNAIEVLHGRTRGSEIVACRNHPRFRLALITSLPQEMNRITDCTDLFPEFGTYYDIDVIVVQGSVTDPWVLANCPIRSVKWFEAHSVVYDRILYHFGSSPHDAPMFRLMRDFPGVVVLHDLYLADVKRFLTGDAAGEFLGDLYLNHGYSALLSVKDAENEDAVRRQYPMTRDVLENAVGVIVDSRDCLESIARFYGEKLQNYTTVLDKTINILDDLYNKIEILYKYKNSSVESVIEYIKEIAVNFRLTKQNIIDISNSIEKNQILSEEKQLLVDISELVRTDFKTGIQRVVRSILLCWLRNPPSGYRVEPIYTADESGCGYRYARSFTSDFLGIPKIGVSDAPVHVAPGDIFVGLDLCGRFVVSNESVLRLWRTKGVGIFFVVYDILPITLPHAFPMGAKDAHTQWLESVSRVSDALVCISSAVADEVREWLQKNPQNRNRPLRIEWFHLGADLEGSAPSRGMPADSTQILSRIASRPSFLMIGTVEPRKGHEQTVDAFEYLWKKGIDANLVIVGKEGWTHISKETRRIVANIAKKIRSQKEFGKRLFWLEGISDEYLEKIYKECNALIAASLNEGYGLPLIEAARYKIPIIARDIPVFREVAGENAFYFSGSEPTDLGNAICSWLSLRDKGQVIASDGMRWKTWQESAQDLLDHIRK